MGVAVGVGLDDGEGEAGGAEGGALGPIEVVGEPVGRGVGPGADGGVEGRAGEGDELRVVGRGVLVRSVVRGDAVTGSSGVAPTPSVVGTGAGSVGVTEPRSPVVLVPTGSGGSGSPSLAPPLLARGSGVWPTGRDGAPSPVGSPGASATAVGSAPDEYDSTEISPTTVPPATRTERITGATCARRWPRCHIEKDS